MMEPVQTERVVIHLGVAEFPYSYDAAEPRPRARRRKRRLAGLMGHDDTPVRQASTTGDVAQILEDKYGVMSTFVLLHEPEIADFLANGLAGSLETIIQGGPPPANPFAGGESAVEQSFRTFLDSKEIESTGIPGVPTMAAQRGVSHRFKHPYAKREPRPSFIDTGTYSSAFRVWVTT
jgi:hypothetical protein